MGSNEQIKFEDTGNQVDRSISFWDIQPMGTESNGTTSKRVGVNLFPRPEGAVYSSPVPNFVNTELDISRALNPSVVREAEKTEKKVKRNIEAGENVMDAKTERFLWIFAAVLVLVIIVFWQCDSSKGRAIDKIKNDVEFRGKEIEIVRDDIKSGQDSWVKLFTAQQQTNNLLTQSVLESKSAVGELEKRVVAVNSKTEAADEKMDMLVKTLDSATKALVAVTSQPADSKEDLAAESKPVGRSSANGYKTATRSVTITSPKATMKTDTPPATVSSANKIETDAKPVKKFRFYNPFTWGSSEKPKVLTASGRDDAS